MQSSNNRFGAESLNLNKYFLGKNLKKDLPASIVVFLVALPLCLGIALASGAPLFAGLLAGIIGGIVVGSMSGSELSVSGPAAGLATIIFGAIAGLGSFNSFLLAVVLAGLLQIVLGLIKAGSIANYFPSSVIEGMLAAIGVILILKQFPHAIGYDADFEGDEDFVQDSGNTFSGVSRALARVNFGAVIIASVSLLLLIYWPKIKKVNFIPAPLMVVLAGVALSQLFANTDLALLTKQYVKIPVVNNSAEFFGLFQSPNFKLIGDRQIWVTAFTIAGVASLETLLSLEAVDKIDPIKRVSPVNRELIAQGIGNTISGLLGGLPMTAVIVRSSANVNAGARTKVSTMVHGLLLLLAVVFVAKYLNFIPLSCLAAILLMTGYKLAKPSLFKVMWKRGLNQFIPFMATIVAVYLTDLLIGVGIGMLIGIYYILRTNLRNPYFYTIVVNGSKKLITIKLAQQVTFLNKASIQLTLSSLPEHSEVVIDGEDSRFIDPDIIEVIHNFRHNAFTKGIIVTLHQVKDVYEVPKLKELIYDSH